MDTSEPVNETTDVCNCPFCPHLQRDSQTEHPAKVTNHASDTKKKSSVALGPELLPWLEPAPEIWTER
jgi:hypothetical protein